MDRFLDEGDPALIPLFVRIQRHVRTPLPESSHRNGHAMKVLVFMRDGQLAFRFDSISDCHKHTGWSRETILKDKRPEYQIRIIRHDDD